MKELYIISVLSGGAGGGPISDKSQALHPDQLDGAEQHLEGPGFS